MYGDKGWVFFTTWDDLIERGKQSHYQFREILEKRAAESTEAQESNGNAYIAKKIVQETSTNDAATAEKRAATVQARKPSGKAKPKKKGRKRK